MTSEIETTTGDGGLFRKAAGGVKRLGGDCSGATLVFTALAMPVMLGVAALGLDASSWYMNKRQIQGIADLGAHVAAVERMAGASKADATAAVMDLATKNGFEDGVDGNLLVNIPPASGPRAGDTNFIEVIVERTGNVFFASMMLDAPVSISARAVSGSGNLGDNCVLALDPGAAKAIEFSGNADATFDCGVMANSTDDAAITVGGRATLTTSDPLQTAGGIVESGDGEIVYTDAGVGSFTGVSPIADPYAGLEVPTYEGSCAMSGDGAGVIHIDGTVPTLSEGFYCGTLQFNSNADVTLNPGVYVIYGGDFDITSGAKVTGDGVTIILTAADPANTGTITIAGNSIVTLTAPGRDGHEQGDYIGEYGGILFSQDPDAPSNGTNTVGGGANAILAGALYFPNQKVSFNGNSNVSNNCLQIVANQVHFAGASNVGGEDAACQNLGLREIGIEVARLFE